MYRYRKLPLSSITPEGVMKAQLRAQLDGLSGHMDELFPDVGLNSAWLGGNGEAWERGPYFLTGLVPLAFLTRDPWALARMDIWIGAILAGQRADGDFGPESNPDWWPRFVVLKTLAGYYRAKEDGRVIDFLDRYFRFMYENLDDRPLRFWAHARGLEAMEAIELLYSRRPLPYLEALVEKLRSYTLDYFTLFGSFPYDRKTSAYLPKTLFRAAKGITLLLERRKKTSARGRQADRAAILRENARRTNRLFLGTHGVNLAMAFKYPATYGAFTGKTELCALSRKGYESVYRFHGNSTGLFSCDEHLMGTSPVQGIELCAAAEMMYSLEEIGRVTGEAWAFELLEFIAYNAFPAMFTPDMTAHQYVQQPNQSASDRNRRPFYDTDKWANTFGVAPNFGCCAANMHAGFPLFSGYMAIAHEKGIAFPVYGACTVRTEWNGGPLEIEERGEYPFGDRILFRVKEAEGEVELHFRPVSCAAFSIRKDGVEMNPEATPEGMLKVPAKRGDEIEIRCPGTVNIVTNPDGSKSIRFGILLMALGLSEREIYLKGRRPFHDRGFASSEPFVRTPLSEDGDVCVKDLVREPVGRLPFASAPVRLIVEGREIRGAGIRHHSARIPLPEAHVLREKTEMELVPYGTARLRISHFPVPRGDSG